MNVEANFLGVTSGFSYHYLIFIVDMFCMYRILLKQLQLLWEVAFNGLIAVFNPIEG